MNIAILPLIGALVIFGLLWWAANTLLTNYALRVAQVLLVVVFVIWILGLFGMGPNVSFR